MKKTDLRGMRGDNENGDLMFFKIVALVFVAFVCIPTIMLNLDAPGWAIFIEPIILMAIGLALLLRLPSERALRESGRVPAGALDSGSGHNGGDGTFPSSVLVNLERIIDAEKHGIVSPELSRLAVELYDARHEMTQEARGDYAYCLVEVCEMLDSLAQEKQPYPMQVQFSRRNLTASVTAELRRLEHDIERRTRA